MRPLQVEFLVDIGYSGYSPFLQTKTMLRKTDGTKMVHLGHRLMIRKTAPFTEKKVEVHLLVNTRIPSRGLGRGRTVHEPDHKSTTIVYWN